MVSYTDDITKLFLAYKSKTSAFNLVCKNCDNNDKGIIDVR